MTAMLFQTEREDVAGYRLEAVLGRGRHATVYRARQRHGERKVALKVVHAGRDQGGATPDLRAEFAAQSALAHPHVIQVFEHGPHGDAAFIAMEYAGLGSIARSREPLGPTRVLTLFTQAASGLAWLHRKGWVHQDVKPANLLLRTDGSLALGDLGCAARCGERRSLPPGTMVGTPRYAAPEQTQGAPAQPAADVYALGACLYEMLCGQPVFPGETSIELLGQHLLAPLPRLHRDHAAWQALLDAMLAKDPGERIADAAAVLAQLRPIGRYLLRGPANETRCAS